MGFLEGFFDFNKDGKVDGFERAIQFDAFAKMIDADDDEKDDWDSDDWDTDDWDSDF